MTTTHGPRPVRAPRGLELTARGWPQEAALRMLICPALVLALMKLTGAAALAPDGDTILLISLLAAMAPTAAMITQISQIYKQDAVYASAINVFTTLCCIVTMPAFVYVYELI